VVFVLALTCSYQVYATGCDMTGQSLGDGTSLAAATAAGAALIIREYFRYALRARACVCVHKPTRDHTTHWACSEGWFATGAKTSDSRAVGFFPSGALTKVVRACVRVMLLLTFVIAGDTGARWRVRVGRQLAQRVGHCRRRHATVQRAGASDVTVM
jgi:hypothetical protein